MICASKLVKKRHDESELEHRESKQMLPVPRAASCTKRRLESFSWLAIRIANIVFEIVLKLTKRFFYKFKNHIYLY
jgi:hypothetical protein